MSPFSYGNSYSSGVPLMLHGTSLGYAFELTGDRYYLEIGYQLLHEGMRKPEELTSRSRLANPTIRVLRRRHTVGWQVVLYDQLLYQPFSQRVFDTERQRDRQPRKSTAPPKINCN